MASDLYNTSRSIEKMRVQMGNRLHAVDRQVDVLDDGVMEFYERVEKQLRDWEDELDKLLIARLDDYKVWDYWLKHVQGVGGTMAAHLLNMLIEPIPDKGPGMWFKAAGLYVDIESNRMPHPTKGEKITYHSWLRRCIWLQADIFTKVGGYYKIVYKQHCKRLEAKHVDWTAPHVHSVARWGTVKLFLSHLYEKWLQANGVDYTRKVYAERVLNHHYIPPPEWDGDPKHKI